MRTEEIVNLMPPFEEKDSKWQGTPYESYEKLGTKAKGTWGEEFVKRLLVSKGYKVEVRTSPGHDCIANGLKTEIKFSLASERNHDYHFTFNHISKGKDWEQIIFVGVNGDLDITGTIFTKDNLPLEELFSAQQGGKELGNDDYMTVGERAKKLLWHKKGSRVF